jgi:ATP-dependent helicase/nuclease subunit B
MTKTNTLFKTLDANTTVLTPNRRLSATLHKRYQQYQLEQQQWCWQTPDILPVSSWIQRLYNDYTSQQFALAPLLLNAAQEQFLWEKIVLHAKESEQLLQVSETADIAKSAWNLLKQWNIDINQSLFHCAEDYATFLRWATAFEKQCQENNWVDVATLPTMLLAKIKQGHIALSKHIVLIGFTEHSPQLRELLKQCEQSGCSINIIDTLSNDETLLNRRLSLLDAEKEMLTIARFAKSTLEKNKTATIGCVIPSLEKVRDRAMQIFSDVLGDDNLFNISAGKNLARYPLINTALQLLGLHKKTIALEPLHYLLASPFLGEAEAERIKRCLFDGTLRQANVTHLDLRDSALLTKHCPHLARRLRQFFARLDEQKNALTYTEWANLFNELLSTLGWPGERSLSSEEYQVVESWLKLLADFTSFDQMAAPTSLQQALYTLQKMAAKTIFQAQTPEAPIQVLGILEAAALPFDYLWIAGMDDASWPPQPKPNPFIPKRLQRELNMPHATPERELMFCQLLLAQFKQSANTLIFSHAEKNGELDLQASPLIRHVPSIHPDELNLDVYLTPSERLYQTKCIETLVDDIAPVVDANENIRGGVNILKQQALCPFKAFAECRLHAHELESPLPGLRSKDRGNIIHKVMELLWNKLDNQAALIALSREQQNKLLDEVIDLALTSTIHSRSDYTQYLSLEKQRLHQLISEWLEGEKERPPFHVLTSEKAAQIKLGQLTLSIRIDRIDALDDGKKLIIDYKTGKNNDINSWFSERPEEPQLPLYSLVDEQNTVGISFAQVASGEHCFKGISRYSLDIKGVKLLSEIKKATVVSWPEQLIQWKSALEKLSADFYQGMAKVDPSDADQTCLWCALKPLCRINEEGPA